MRRLVRRGEAASEARSATLAIAMGHELQRQRNWTEGGWFGFLVFITAAWAAYAVVLFNDGDEVLGAVLAVGAVWFGWTLLSMRRRFERADEAVAANRAVLERLGEPYVAPPRDVESPPRATLILALVAAFVFYAVIFGLLNAIYDNDFDLGRMAGTGVAFAVVMTVGNHLFLRSRS